MASLYASDQKLADRRGKLRALASSADAMPAYLAEDENLRQEQLVIVDLMRQEAARSREVPPAVESILAEER